MDDDSGNKLKYVLKHDNMLVDLIDFLSLKDGCLVGTVSTKSFKSGDDLSSKVEALDTSLTM